jgi:hypothetical protein
VGRPGVEADQKALSWDFEAQVVSPNNLTLKIRFKGTWEDGVRLLPSRQCVFLLYC